jgi:hypothetical protein
MGAMYVIGAGRLSEFAEAHPQAGHALRALAARLAAQPFPDAAALAAALGEHASAEGPRVTIDLSWCGARVRLAYDASARVVLVVGVDAIRASRKKEKADDR